MQGQLEKKKEEQKLLEEPKKKQLPAMHATLTTEGPMKLADSVRQSEKIEAGGRTSFEKSVHVELDAIKKRLMGKLKKKGGKEEKKPRYGWKLADGDEPLGDEGDKGEGGGSNAEGEEEKKD